jgi:hypothetical protein
MCAAQLIPTVGGQRGIVVNAFVLLLAVLAIAVCPESELAEDHYERIERET